MFLIAHCLQVQLWEHNGKLRKNIAVGTATIDLHELELHTKGPVTGQYSMFKPGKSAVTVASPYSSLRPSRQATRNKLTEDDSAQLSTQVDPEELRKRLETI